MRDKGMGRRLAAGALAALLTVGLSGCRQQGEPPARAPEGLNFSQQADLTAGVLHTGSSGGWQDTLSHLEYSSLANVTARELAVGEDLAGCDLVIADPALLRRARGGPAASKEELRGYFAELYAGYTAAFGSPQAAISRMKAHWHEAAGLFEGSDKLAKQLKKLRDPWEYEVTVGQLFTLPLRK